MKTVIITMVFALLSTVLLAQAPDAINYQAVVRDNGGNIIANQSVTFRLSILQGSASGPVVYSESQLKTTSQLGLATLEIGRGTFISGSFGAIAWGSGSYYLQTEMDPAGGSAYQLMGTTQLLSVPYALYAKQAASAPNYVPGKGLSLSGDTLNSVWTETSTSIYANNTGNAGIGTSNPASTALLELQSTNQGFLVPRLTTVQIEALFDPADGLLVYNTTAKKFFYFNGTREKWLDMTMTDSISPPASGTITDPRNGQTYDVITIGTQKWMKQNMNIGTKVNAVTSQSDNGTIEKHCMNDDVNNCTVYGGLYQWNEAMQYSTVPGAQGICPSGYHVPTDAEWCTLVMYLDPTVNCSLTSWFGTNAGGKLKETGTEHWMPANTGATNESGFTALGGGYSSGGTYGLFASVGHWWTSSTTGTDHFLWMAKYQDALIGRWAHQPTYGFSVRCIKN